MFLFVQNWTILWDIYSHLVAMREGDTAIFPDHKFRDAVKISLSQWQTCQPWKLFLSTTCVMQRGGGGGGDCAYIICSIRITLFILNISQRSALCHITYYSCTILDKLRITILPQNKIMCDKILLLQSI